MNSTSFVPSISRTETKIQNNGSNQPYTATGDSVPSEAKADEAQIAGGNGEHGHFNQITQKWEPNGQRQAVETSQGASTMPDADGGHENKPGFGDKMGGMAKKLTGKVSGKNDQVAAGDALLHGASKQEAQRIAEQVKRST